MKYLTSLFIAMLLLNGCYSYLSVNNPQDYGLDANSPIIAKGEAAVTLAKQLADNIKTKQGLTADIYKQNGPLYAGLIITMVAGFIFWGFTRSKYGWIVPSACIAGIATILFFVNYSQWIAPGVLVIVLAVLVWKAIEYKKERNVNLAKLQKLESIGAN